MEVLSKSTAYNDRIVKKEIYEVQGVKYYLIADPKKEIVEIFELVDGKYQTLNRTTFELGINCAVSLRFSEIWE